MKLKTARQVLLGAAAVPALCGVYPGSPFPSRLGCEHVTMRPGCS